MRAMITPLDADRVIVRPGRASATVIAACTAIFALPYSRTQGAAMKHVALLIGIGALLGLSACVQSHWDKPNATSETASVDLAECRRAAQAEAFRQVDRYGYAGAPMWRYSPYADSFWSRANYEQ